MFVPPPREEVSKCLAPLERFLNDEPEPVPPLLKAALAHVQFETIHPFLDGNGRIGRLLIVLQLVADGVLREPMLYPSLYFKKHRALYYELLNEVGLRGDWERWLDFFAEGIEVSATQAVATANTLLALVNADRDRIAPLGRAAPSALAVHHAMQRQPIATAASLVKTTGLTAATVNKSLAHLERIDIAVMQSLTRKGEIKSLVERCRRSMCRRTPAFRMSSVNLPKTDVRIIDFIDAGHPALLRMWNKRQRGYRAMGIECFRNSTHFAPMCR